MDGRHFFDKRFIDFYVKSTLGFNPYNKKPMDVQRYKFKMDIFRQLNQRHNIICHEGGAIIIQYTGRKSMNRIPLDSPNCYVYCCYSTY